MGYDMYQLTTPALAEQSKETHQREIDEAQAALDAITDQAGSWLLPGELETIDKDEVDELVKSRRIAQRAKLSESPEGPGMSIGEMGFRMLESQTVPASAEYVKRSRALQKAQFATAEHSEYFRLNIWGMSAYRDAMAELGMLKSSQWKDWPEYPDDVPEEVTEQLDEVNYDCTRDPDVTRERLVAVMREYRDANEVEFEILDAHIEAIADYQIEYLAHISQNDETIPGIEEVKFSSNDGWLVTPHECGTAVAIWDATTEEQRAAVEVANQDYWRLWIQFLENGATGAGFRVH